MEEQLQNINIDIQNDTTQLICEQCQNESFIPSFLFRKVSGILVGQPTDSFIPIQVYECSACGHINKEFLPSQLK